MGKKGFLGGQPRRARENVGEHPRASLFLYVNGQISGVFDCPASDGQWMRFSMGAGWVGILFSAGFHIQVSRWKGY